MARAQAKFIRMSPRKLRRVVNVIRGNDASGAQTILKFMPYSAARVVEKVLKSAVANARENEKLNPDELRITMAYVDQSVTLRRWRAMSRGRAYPILKKTSHVTIEVNHDPSLAEVKDRRQARFVPGKKEELKKDEHIHVKGEEHKHEEKKADTKLSTKRPKAKELKEVKNIKERTKDKKKKKEKKEKEE